MAWLAVGSNHVQDGSLSLPIPVSKYTRMLEVWQPNGTRSRHEVLRSSRVCGFRIAGPLSAYWGEAAHVNRCCLPGHVNTSKLCLHADHPQRVRCGDSAGILCLPGWLVNTGGEGGLIRVIQESARGLVWSDTKMSIVMAACMEIIQR